MASELYVETLKGLTSGANANKVIVPAGQTLDASAGSVVLPAGAGGKVLQVVQINHATQVTTTSKGYVTTNLSASITPSSTSSNILVLVAFPADKESGDGGDFTVYRDGATDLLTRGGDTYYLQGGANLGVSVAINFLDSPSTTSSTSYTVFMRARAAGSTIMKSCHNGSTGNITLMEIAG